MERLIANADLKPSDVPNSMTDWEEFALTFPK